jgi:hypothetical protein
VVEGREAVVNRHRKNADKRAAIDGLLASQGDLDAIERMQQRERIRRATDVTATSEPTRPPSSKSKGAAPATLIAIQAIAAVIYDENPFPRKAATLAERAASKAQELGLPGADALKPRNSSMREIAGAFLRGIEAADRN